MLARHGDSVAVFELQGDLFFGSTERLFRSVVGDIAGVEAVVLDCKRVGNVDGAAVAMLTNLRAALDDIGCVLVVAEDGPAGALADVAMRSFDDADTALEWCEDRMLLRTGSLTSLLPEELGIQELLQGLSDEELAAVERVAVILKVGAGEVVFRESDQADAIFFVLSGLVSVRLPLGGQTRDRRLATLGGGVAVGEMAFLDEGLRSADVVAEEETLVARLSIDDLHRIGEEMPGVIAEILCQPGPQPLRSAAARERAGADARPLRADQPSITAAPGATASRTVSPTSGIVCASRGTSTCSTSP